MSMITIRKKPVKVGVSGLSGLLLYFVVLMFLFSSFEMRIIGFFVCAISLAILVVLSFLVPYLGGVDLKDGRVETITGFGGLISVKIDQLDRQRSNLSEIGLVLVPLHGEKLFMPSAQYSKDDILRVAHYVGLATHGWAQEV